MGLFNKIRKDKFKIAGYEEAVGREWGGAHALCVWCAQNQKLLSLLYLTNFSPSSEPHNPYRRTIYVQQKF